MCTTNASDAHIGGGVSAFISKQKMKLNSKKCEKRQDSIMNVNCDFFQQPL